MKQKHKQTTTVRLESRGIPSAKRVPVSEPSRVAPKSCVSIESISKCSLAICAVSEPGSPQSATHTRRLRARHRHARNIRRDRGHAPKSGARIPHRRGVLGRVSVVVFVRVLARVGIVLSGVIGVRGSRKLAIRLSAKIASRLELSIRGRRTHRRPLNIHPLLAHNPRKRIPMPRLGRSKRKVRSGQRPSHRIHKRPRRHMHLLLLGLLSLGLVVPNTLRPGPRIPIPARPRRELRRQIMRSRHSAHPWRECPVHPRLGTMPRLDTRRRGQHRRQRHRLVIPIRRMTLLLLLPHIRNRRQQPTPPLHPRPPSRPRPLIRMSIVRMSRQTQMRIGQRRAPTESNEGSAANRRNVVVWRGDGRHGGQPKLELAIPTRSSKRAVSRTMDALKRSRRRSTTKHRGRGRRGQKVGMRGRRRDEEIRTRRDRVGGRVRAGGVERRDVYRELGLGRGRGRGGWRAVVRHGRGDERRVGT
ncbi:hypothetical protein BDV93DRAFT_203003 [Ceratobasidium sp. AG-I]|nr:hypothetical protein BDV93DRAFT_203003 [Ceratobasidium sp. AG-I]